MITTAAFGPSMAALRRGLGHGRPQTRLRIYALIAAAAFACYILSRLIEGAVSLPLEVVGVGACGWSWLLARALFDPAEHDSWWPRIVAGIVVATGALAILWPAHSLAARIAGNAYALSGSATLMLTFVEPFHRYSRDLPPAEKRFRIAFLALYILLVALSTLGLVASEDQAGMDRIQVGCALVGLAGAMAAVWFRLGHPLAWAEASTPRRAPTAEDARLAERLLRLLREDQIDSEPDLRIGDVAARLGEPEYRVSQCISAALGFPNFNRLINHHRIARAKRLLADPDDDRSILDVAFDCGFGSVGPFNRSFKAEVGVTPRAFRTESRRP